MSKILRRSSLVQDDNDSTPLMEQAQASLSSSSLSLSISPTAAAAAAAPTRAARSFSSPVATISSPSSSSSPALSRTEAPTAAPFSVFVAGIGDFDPNDPVQAAAAASAAFSASQNASSSSPPSSSPPTKSASPTKSRINTVSERRASVPSIPPPDLRKKLIKQGADAADTR